MGLVWVGDRGTCPPHVFGGGGQKALRPPHVFMNSMKLVIPLHPLYWSIHTKDESKRETAFAFIFGVN